MEPEPPPDVVGLRLQDTTPHDMKAVIGSSHHLAQQVADLAQALQRQTAAQEILCSQMRAIAEKMDITAKDHDGAASPLVPSHAAEGYEFLTDDMIGGIKEIFDVFDSDKSGELSQTETIQLVQRLGLGSQADGVRLVEKIDANNDGGISFDELIEYMDGAAGGDDAAGNALDFTGATTAKAGYGGTTWRKHANIAWLSCSCLIIIAGAVLVYGFVYFEHILVPLTMGWFLTFLIGPIVDLLEQRPLVCGYNHYICKQKPGKRCCQTVDTDPEKRGCRGMLADLCFVAKLPHSVAVICALIIFFGLLGGTGMVFTYQILDLSSDPSFIAQVENATWALGDTLSETMGVDVVELQRPLTNESQAATNELVSITDLIEQYGMFGSIANDATITLLLMVFMLAGRDPRTVEDVKRMHDQPRTMTLVEEIDTMMSYYIVLKSEISLLTGLAVMFTFIACGVRMALVWGVMTFLLNFIPNVGSMMALVAPLPVILLDDQLSTVQLVIALVVPAIVQLSVGNGLEPMLFGSALNLTSISILASLVMFGAMWGLPGAILSVPLLAVIRILLTRADHPMAKRVLHVIRENNSIDELLVMREKNKKQVNGLLLLANKHALRGLAKGITGTPKRRILAEEQVAREHRIARRATRIERRPLASIEENGTDRRP